jgi:hypothetical protein
VGGRHAPELVAGFTGIRNSQRCDKALKVMDEWEIDYIWSATQHRIGAEFGISQCRPLNDDESIEGFACKVIEH